jgi:RNA polymerase sigma factor (sigma-70 family)
VKTESDVWELEGTNLGSYDSPRLFERFGMKPRENTAEENAVFWTQLSPLKTNLYNFILKSLNFATDADDVYQETVLHGFQYFASFHQDKEFRAWIFSIAHNEIKRHFRKTRKRADLGALNLPLITSPGEDAALVKEIYRYAAGLKSREREIFFLFYESGFSINEIEEITNLKSGYIKLLLHQARANLKTKLGVSHD